MVPVPETLMSPDVCPASVAQRVTVSAINTQIQQTKINKNKGTLTKYLKVNLNFFPKKCFSHLNYILKIV